MNPPEEMVLDTEAVSRILRRMASEIATRTQKAKQLGLVGVLRGGLPLARRLAEEIHKAEGRKVPVGALDITLYRDDTATALPDPKVGPSNIEFTIDGSDVVLVDDVLHTGRTIRAAIDSLFDYGRPRRIWLAVLCDRGGRQLPIAPDFVGRSFEVPEGFTLEVISDSAHGESDERVLLHQWRPSQAPPRGPA